MKKSTIVILFVIILFMIYIIKQRLNKNPRVFYFPGPDNLRFAAITLPPFGIFVNNNSKSLAQDDRKKQLLVHEGVHWKQFQNMGMPDFYYNYVKGYVNNGGDYSGNPMEQEAFLLANETSHVNENVIPTNYSGLLT